MVCRNAHKHAYVGKLVFFCNVLTLEPIHLNDTTFLLEPLLHNLGAPNGPTISNICANRKVPPAVYFVFASMQRVQMVHIKVIDFGLLFFYGFRGDSVDAGNAVDRDT